MANTEDDEQIEDDPRIANIYRRMRLIVGVSLVLMAAGFFVVFGVIVYRLTQHAAPSGEAALAGLGLPDDARLVSMAADDGRLYLAVESGGKTAVHVLDGARLTPIGRVELGRKPPPAAVPMTGPGGAAR